MQADHTSSALTARSIRSFVVRNGRITPAQTEAIKQLMPRYGIPYQLSPISTSDLFDQPAPLCLEIGFGNGDALISMASAEPQLNFIGVDVHSPGVGRVLQGIQAAGLGNVRVIQHDAMEVLDTMISDQALSRVLLFFPDPWHKKRHHKRRIVQDDFLDAVARKLKPGGLLHCATDWSEYAEWMLERLEADQRFANQAGAGQYSERPEWRPTTRFEKRGTRLGHTVADLIYSRQ